jgi:hypothetical protein
MIIVEKNINNKTEQHEKTFKVNNKISSYNLSSIIDINKRSHSISLN